MTSATLAAYQDGRTTLHAQQDIIRGYINSIPLAASPGYGDVQGLGDGLWAWYGADVSKIDPLLRAPERSLNPREMRARVEQLIGDSIKGMWLGTFHSLGARLLRREGEAIGIPRTGARTVKLPQPVEVEAR